MCCWILVCVVLGVGGAFSILGVISLVGEVVCRIQDWLADRRAEKLSDHPYLLRPQSYYWPPGGLR